MRFMYRARARIFRSDRGITLVEVIISIALLGILTSLFLTAFTSGIFMAAKSGNNTNVSSSASAITTKISRDVAALPDEYINNYVAEPDKVVVDFNGAGIMTTSVAGIYYTVTAEGISVKSENESKIKSFVPD